VAGFITLAGVCAIGAGGIYGATEGAEVGACTGARTAPGVYVVGATGLGAIGLAGAILRVETGAAVDVGTAKAAGNGFKVVGADMDGFLG
jgi:hypothetical protein